MATNNNPKSDTGMSLPVIGMLLVGIASAVIVAVSTEVINFWPLPPSVAPYFGWEQGLWWGLIPGGVTGLFIGWMVDERHYPNGK